MTVPDRPTGPRPRAPGGRSGQAIRAVVPAVRGVARAARRLALAALAGGALLWWLLADRAVSGQGRAVALALWAAVLLAPPAVLVAIALALRELAALPERLTTLPRRAEERAAELGRLAGEVRDARRRGWLRSGAALFRLWRGAAGSRELLDVVGPAAFLFNPVTLLAGTVATVGAVAEIISGGVAALVLVLL